MNIASRLAAVATEASPEVTRLLVRDGAAPVNMDHEPPRMSYDAATFRKVPAADAVDLVPYLDEESALAVFAKDTRKTVRTAVLEHGRRSPALVVALLRWTAAPDTPYVSPTDVAEMLESCTDEQLDELAAASVCTGSVSTERLRRTTSVADAQAGAGTSPNYRQAAALLCSPCDQVRQWALDAVATELGAFVSKLGVVDHRMVPAVLDSAELHEALVDSYRTVGRYHRGAVVGPKALDRLFAAVGTPHAQRAMDLVVASTDVDTVVPRLTPPMLDLVGAKVALAVLKRERTDAEVATAALHRLAVLVTDDGLDDTVRRGCIEALVGAARTPVREQVCLDVAQRLHQASARTLTRLVSEKWELDAGLRNRLAEVPTDAVTRFALLDPSDTATTFTEVVDALVDELAQGSVDTPTVKLVDQVLARVTLGPVPLANLAAGLGGTLARLDWRHQGTPANPLTDEVACAAAAVSTDPDTVASVFGHVPGVAQVLVGRCADMPELATRVVWYCPLDDATLLELLEVSPQTAAAALLAGSRANPLTHARRALAVAASGWDVSYNDWFPRPLVESFTKLAPSSDEVYLLTGELFAAAEEDLQNGVDRTDHLYTLLDKVALDNEVVVALLNAAPRLLSLWTGSKGHVNVFHTDVVRDLVRSGFTSATADAALVVAAHCGADPEVRQWLQDSPAFVEGLRSSGRRWVHTYRLAWEMLHDLVGDDVAVLEQVCALLDRWPGSITDLVATAEVSAGKV